jgi:hypothetical protein
MAKQSNGASKSEQIRQLLKASPEIKAHEAVAKLAEKGVKISGNLFYYVKGQMKGRKARRKKAQRAVTKVAESTHVTRVDAVTTIRKVKSLANEVGGMKTLKALVEALSE